MAFEQHDIVSEGAAELEEVWDCYEEVDLEDDEAPVKAILVEKVVLKTIMIDLGKSTVPGKQIMHEISKSALKTCMKQ